MEWRTEQRTNTVVVGRCDYSFSLSLMFHDKIFRFSHVQTYLTCANGHISRITSSFLPLNSHILRVLRKSPTCPSRITKAFSPQYALSTIRRLRPNRLHRRRPTHSQSHALRRSAISNHAHCYLFRARRQHHHPVHFARPGSLGQQNRRLHGLMEN